MNYFSEISEGQAIVCAGGVYRQSKIAVRGGKIYVKYGAGYVRLTQGGATSHPKLRWYEIDAGDGTHREEKGYVYYVAPLKAAS